MNGIDKKLKRLIELNIESDILELIYFSFIEGHRYGFNDVDNTATWLLSDRTEKILSNNLLYGIAVGEYEMRKQREKMTRKTYLMKDQRNGLYKIGRSYNPKLREATLQGENPNIVMVKIWERDIEKDLHKQYESQRVRGEWFELSKVQVKYLTSKE